MNNAVEIFRNIVESHLKRADEACKDQESDIYDIMWGRRDALREVIDWLKILE